MAATLAVAPAVHAAAAGGQHCDARRSGRDGEKRAERLQDVPVSITALSADQLVSLKLNSGTDIAKYTPNLRISNAGNEDQPKISIRGVSQFDFNLNASSADRRVLRRGVYREPVPRRSADL